MERGIGSEYPTCTFSKTAGKGSFMFGLHGVGKCFVFLALGWNGMGWDGLGQTHDIGMMETAAQ
jgi:hypothetical protein